MYILGGYDGEYLGDIWQFDPNMLNMTRCEVKAAPANSFTYRNYSTERVERAPRGHLLLSQSDSELDADTLTSHYFSQEQADNDRIDAVDFDEEGETTMVKE